MKKKLNSLWPVMSRALFASLHSMVGDRHGKLDAAHRLISSFGLGVDSSAEHLDDAALNASTCGGLLAYCDGNIKFDQERSRHVPCRPKRGIRAVRLPQDRRDARLYLISLFNGGNNINEALPQKLMEVHI